MITAVYVLIAVAAWGISPIFDKVALAKIDPLFGIGLRGVTVSIVTVSILWGRGELGRVTSLNIKAAVMIIVAGVLASFIGQWAYFNALKVNEASKIVPLCSTYPLVAALLGVLVLGEPITLARIGGVILIVLGILLVK